jgi:hypothetical protein
MKESGSLKRPKKNVTENFRKRKITLMMKVDELKRDFGGEVYVLVWRNGKYFTYASSDRPAWPSSVTEVVSSLLQIKVHI